MPTKKTTKTLPFASSGNLVTAARDHASGGLIARLEEAITKAQAEVRNVGLPAMPGVEIQQLGTDLASRLADGGEVGADFYDQVVNVTEHARAQDAERRALGHAITDLRDRQSVALAEATDPALGWLHTQLQLVMDDARQASTHLDGITSAEQAIASTPAVINAWAALTDATAQYKRVRQAQRVITTEARGHANTVREIHFAGTTVVPFDETYAEATGQITAVFNSLNGGWTYTPEPWPGAITDDQAPFLPIPSTNEIAFVRWIADRGDAWVPDTVQLTTALRDRTEQISQHLRQREIDAEPKEHRRWARETA